MDLLGGGEIDFWEEISDAKPSWQLALAQLAMPDMTGRYIYTPNGGKKVPYLQVTVDTDLKSNAAEFSPK